MARRIRSPLEDRTNRLKLKIGGKPRTISIGRGLRLAYRRCKTDGTWSILFADGKGGNTLRQIDGVVADDYQDADGERVLDLQQAISRARIMVLGEDKAAETLKAPLTIDDAIDKYEADLKTRRAGRGNATWLKHRMPEAMRAKVLALTDALEWRAWRDDLVEEDELEPSSINRLMTCARAMCNLAAGLDKRIRNEDAWTIGLERLEGADVARNVVITAEQAQALVAAAYDVSPELGLYVEVGACIGARPSQIDRLDCADAKPGLLMVPVSMKGRGQKKVTHTRTPIAASLSARLLACAKNRPADGPLLRMPSGERWYKTAYHRWFRERVVPAVEGLDPNVHTFYAFRHTRITNMLIAGVNPEIVARAHDTSLVMLKRNYAHLIVDHAEPLLREHAFDYAPDVVPLTTAKGSPRAA